MAEILIAIIFFVLGASLMYVLKSKETQQLNQNLHSWMRIADVYSRKECKRPHIGDINEIEKKVGQQVGKTFDDIKTELNSIFKKDAK